MAWPDTGTCEGLTEAAGFVQAIQSRQSLYVACIEEIAYRQGWISKEQFIELAQPMIKTEYGQYMMEIANDDTV